jgi:hypothetical protein
MLAPGVGGFGEGSRVDPEDQGGIGGELFLDAVEGIDFAAGQVGGIVRQ